MWSIAQQQANRLIINFVCVAAGNDDDDHGSLDDDRAIYLFVQLLFLLVLWLHHVLTVS